MEWFLIIVVASRIGVSEVQVTPMPEAQCRAAIEVLAPLKKHVGVACVGPNGERVEAD